MCILIINTHPNNLFNRPNRTYYKKWQTTIRTLNLLTLANNTIKIHQIPLYLIIGLEPHNHDMPFKSPLRYGEHFLLRYVNVCL